MPKTTSIFKEFAVVQIKKVFFRLCILLTGFYILYVTRSELSRQAGPHSRRRPPAGQYW